jgi:hypothetical protein
VIAGVGFLSTVVCDGLLSGRLRLTPTSLLTPIFGLTVIVTGKNIGSKVIAQSAF